MRSPLPARRGVPALILGALTIAMVGVAAEAPKIDLTGGDAVAGKAVAMDRAKGNCIACHLIIGGESPGSIGPALIAMKTRYPTKEAMALQIWDPTIKNPEAVMPPFGKHEVLSQKELADIVEYVWSL
ncbi:MAG TPA: sulfur oxidation c-type cytochrome SoxX [Lamprocystis sp. (in: g-proteobacteria)]|nr:sulfur oxidation c-type cytochrome SoxX [Lamprocystis sp. (in: g-proteobacteria)]